MSGALKYGANPLKPAYPCWWKTKARTERLGILAEAFMEGMTGKPSPAAEVMAWEDEYFGALLPTLDGDGRWTAFGWVGWSS